ncbi:MAG: hypothetical protein ACHQIG_02820 [Acidimicrobiia bacterium]
MPVRICALQGGDMPRKGRARRFREARELKQGYDDGLFNDTGRSLADVDLDDEFADDVEDEAEGETDGWDDEDDPLDDDPLRDDDAGRRAAM